MSDESVHTAGIPLVVPRRSFTVAQASYGIG
jgi:hypothetical protein